MACYWLYHNDASIEIPSTTEIETVTYYKIVIRIARVQWSVLRRYSEFDCLHNQLVLEHGVNKDILPPKKVIRKKCPVFIETRRRALESYLQQLFSYLKLTMPRGFLQFLHFHHYDIFYLLQELACYFYDEGDIILSNKTAFTLNTVKLFSISECFKSPFPQIDQSDQRFDLSHVLDFCSQLKHLKIQGLPEPYLTSNIVPNDLPFELSSFKSLEELSFIAIKFNNVQNLGNVRSTLKHLSVHHTDIKNIAEVLQCDILHRCDLNNTLVWSMVTVLDLSCNNLESIDETINLVPNLVTLILTGNKITEVYNLSALTKLKHVNLSNNLISSCIGLHTKLGNISMLNLSQNVIISPEGLSKLYSLETLDLSSNQIVDVNAVACLGELPCLQNLLLTANSVSTTIDYRIKVLEVFGERARDVCLDNEKATQPELDKVLVLRALKIVKEGRAPDLNNTSFS